MDFNNAILGLLSEKDYKQLTKKELQMALGVSEDNKQEFDDVINDLYRQGLIFINRNDKISKPERLGVFPCILKMNERGYGFASRIGKNKAGKSQDIYIHSDDINGAMHGDSVMVKVTYCKNSDYSMRCEGQIYYVFKRANEMIVGKYEEVNGFAFILPDNPKITGDILVPKKSNGGAKHNDKVVVRITRWPDKRRNAEGEVVEVLGKAGDPGVDIMSIVREYNIDAEFPDEVLKEAEAIDKNISDLELSERTDYRDLITVTIDGEDAKDLDDAISLFKHDDGSYELYVHIADVSHYVKESTALDTEARKRGASVYLVDRAIPMLPPRLSNDLCSLNAGTEKLCFTCSMQIDQSGSLSGYSFDKSIIRVDKRLTYTEVFEHLTEPEKQMDQDINRYSEMLHDMKKLALTLKEKRRKRGSIEFDFDESKVILDDLGNPTDIIRKKRNLAESIIEEFMIAANETVAENFYHAKIPFIYRIHEVPDKDTLTQLSRFLSVFGLKLKNINQCKSSDINHILEMAKGRGEEKAINLVTLRTMKKAIYSEDNSGHFGLASSYYTHFTSPIRRYPDLFIHRLMSLYLCGELKDKKLDHYSNIVSEVAETSSDMEVRADEAERESLDLKKVEYMQRHLGDTFVGSISNVMSFGFFVELDNTVEGLVKVADLYDDYYIFDEKTYTMIGENSGKRFRIGDKVKVRVAAANVDRRQIDFMLVYERNKKGQQYV